MVSGNKEIDFQVYLIYLLPMQLAFTCSKSTTETLKEVVRNV